MNTYHGASTGNTANAEICYLSPQGHFYVAKGELDAQYARHAQLMTRHQAGFMPGKALSQLELAKRASRG